ncbi:hypothetical protein NUU61_004375 [Penicillium alfredii]|uniref:Protein kinase domain-containing protein n=1 Tax=Penicillium alfredii TaxID=1506179 RepID=A0A9W9FL56_9EURO|nr:uncharacterized protein NUU61_004375 [Penicillium alfredii]KAJ5102153.1 hypothetical protein NUU61_004375 [Penicillium alfredii]
MSMFRSAAEISSSDSDSISEESEDHEQGLSPPRNDLKTESQSPKRGKTTGNVPQRLDATDDTGTNSVDDISALSQDALGVNADRHANVMTHALLEFYCQSRAADILNAQKGSSRAFTRHSPEVQYLGKKLYKHKSKFLSTHGILAGGIDKDELGGTRQNYRDHLDLLGVSALEEMNLNETQKQSPSIHAGKELALVRKPSRNRPETSHVEESTTRFWRAQGENAMFRKQLPSTGEIDILGDISGGARNLPVPSRPLFGSSPVGVPLFNAPAAPPYNQLSRYSVEFSELKVLGRGSFGEVYHVKNHIDGQDYAVKKIPLSKRRLDQLQYGGQNQLETIMKEIRTLARLEHTNIVRYYGAWVEQAHLSNHMSPQQHPEPPRHEATQIDLPSQDPTQEPSMDIIFEHSENSAVGTHSASTNGENGFSDPIQRWNSHATTSSRQSRKSFGRELDDDDEDIESIPRNFDHSSYGQTSTFGGTDDIFTDGLSQDQSKLQVHRPYQSSHLPPAVVLHIQMSLHPISLSSYLNLQAAAKCGDGNSPPRRHCFHIMPSLKLMLDIVSGVEYLHSKGIVHRDLKPANIFLCTPEDSTADTCSSCDSGGNSPVQFCRPRIGDFGLVADISHLNEAASEGAVTPYREGPNIQRVVGTEFYRPPANGQGSMDETSSRSSYFDTYKIDEKLDVYALGVILFEIVYRLNTKMERQLVLNDLTRGSSSQGRSQCTSFPTDFPDKVDLGCRVLQDGESVAESLMACIRGMLAPPSRQRWSCGDVREHLRKIYKAVKRLDKPQG